MPKKKTYRRSSSFTLPLAPIGGFIGAEATQGIIRMLADGNIQEAIKFVPHYAGVASDGVFSMDIAMKNWLPIGIGFAVHWVASKLGINRMLARYKVPIVRL